ncbi:FYVE-type domain-containing protein [Plasmodiophora brassicae]
MEGACENILLERTGHLYPPVWVDPDVQTRCAACGAKPGKWERHHCRLCGNIVCSLCSAKFRLPGRFEKKRSHANDLCRVCFGCRDACVKYWAEERPIPPSMVRCGYRQTIVDGRVHIHPPVIRSQFDYPQCLSCGRLHRKRHSCRLCGECFCNECSIKIDHVPAAFQIKFKTGPVRVCLPCRYRLKRGAILDGTVDDSMTAGDYDLSSFATLFGGDRFPRAPPKQHNIDDDKGSGQGQRAGGTGSRPQTPTGTVPWISHTNQAIPRGSVLFSDDVEDAGQDDVGAPFDLAQLAIGRPTSTIVYDTIPVPEPDIDIQSFSSGGTSASNQHLDDANSAPPSETLIALRLVERTRAGGDRTVGSLTVPATSTLEDIDRQIKLAVPILRQYDLEYYFRGRSIYREFFDVFVALHFDEHIVFSKSLSGSE